MSQLAIRGCSFDAIGDKALSIGEDSEVTAESCQIVTAAIAVAAKDRSTVTLVDLAVDAVDHYVFAAYIKKPEFGASKLYAKGLRYGGEGAPKHLAQTGCVVRVEGQEVATRDVDVELLYRQKVLGK